MPQQLAPVPSHESIIASRKCKSRLVWAGSPVSVSVVGKGGMDEFLRKSPLKTFMPVPISAYPCTDSEVTTPANSEGTPLLKSVEKIIIRSGTAVGVALGSDVEVGAGV